MDNGFFMPPNKLLSGIREIPKTCIRTKQELAMAAFAFMHCTAFETDGDIELDAKEIKVKVIERNEITDNFEEFYAEFRQCGADSFHARCSVDLHDYALISAKYNHLHYMLKPGVAAIFHPGPMGDKKVYAEICEETMKFLELLKKGQSIPPIREKENEYPVRCYSKRVNTKKVAVDLKTVKARDGYSFTCHRPDFHFNCLKRIRCCGQCEMLEKTYHLLVEDALDEATGKELTAMVEKVGLFRKKEDGAYENCIGCSPDCEGGEGGCPKAVQEAKEVIRGLWYKCYDRAL